MATTTLATPAGPLTLVADGKTVLAAGFTAEPAEMIARIHPDLRPRAVHDADLDALAATVTAYFDGDLTAIDGVDVVQRSGPFIQIAWDALRKVPAGEPVTYTDLALRAGRPAAIRAAAQACARNAIALFVPCHRIVRTDGTLAGYLYGLDVKRWLLAHERRQQPEALPVPPIG